MIADITKAIGQAKMLKIHYKNSERFIEPYTLGYGSENQILLRAFQVAGGTPPSDPIGWRMFRLDRVTHCEVLPTPARSVAAGYRKGDPVMKLGIIAER